MVTVVKKGKRKNVIRLSGSDLIFDIINTIIMIIFIFIMFYPLYYTIIASLSDINALGLGKVYFLPKGFTLDAYKNVFANTQVWTGYKNSIIYAVLSTLYKLVIMIPLAYCLSKKNLFGRNALSWYFLFTMYFSGGLIPTFLLMERLRLINTRWIMILGAVSVYNMIVTRTFFQTSIPEELYESARIDGASEFRNFFSIALPLSGTIVAVMALFQAIGSWNSYFGAMIYLTKKEFFPLQLVLRSVLILNQEMIMRPDIFQALTVEEQELAVQRARMAETMKYSFIFIGSAPLLIAYPFAQKYFVKGVTIGSLKG